MMVLLIDYHQFDFVVAVLVWSDHLKLSPVIDHRLMKQIVLKLVENFDYLFVDCCCCLKFSVLVDFDLVVVVFEELYK